MIKSVRGLKIGHMFVCNNAIWEVINFPTRYKVRGKIIKNTSPILCSTFIEVSMSNIYFDNVFNMILFGEFE